MYTYIYVYIYIYTYILGNYKICLVMASCYGTLCFGMKSASFMSD